ncbi:MAG: FAD-dependent monooxygenase [Pseudomonadota bacterium]
MGFDTDIAIVGGGLNGAMMALALSGTGLKIAVIDAQKAGAQDDPTFDGRSYAMALSSVRLMQALGIWDELADTAQPILDIKVSDGRAGEGPSPLFMHFDHREIEEGPMGHMVEDRHLRRVLRASVSSADGVALRPETSVIAQEAVASGITLQLTDGPLRARLAIAADGRDSGTAARAGIKYVRRSYQQTALVCAIAHEHPHHGVAHQFFMPPGPLAILPLRDNRASIVWSETAETAARINALSDADYIEILRPRFGGFRGSFELAGARYTYPLNLSLAQEMTATRVALVGDAAHGVHPIAGQGLNAGLRDIAALAEVISDAKRRGEDFGALDVLVRYQQWRRFDNAALAMATDGFNRLFSNDNPVIRTVRGIGMGVVNAAPLFRRSFIREAAGLTGTLPRLLRGESL